MGAPSYDAETLAKYFHSVDVLLWNTPRLKAILEAVRKLDPILVEAVSDVDRWQVRHCLDMDPFERYDLVRKRWIEIEGMRNGVK